MPKRRLSNLTRSLWLPTVFCFGPMEPALCRSMPSASALSLSLSCVSRVIVREQRTVCTQQYTRLLTAVPSTGTGRKTGEVNRNRPKDGREELHHTERTLPKTVPVCKEVAQDISLVSSPCDSGQERRGDGVPKLPRYLETNARVNTHRRGPCLYHHPRDECLCQHTSQRPTPISPQVELLALFSNPRVAPNSPIQLRPLQLGQELKHLLRAVPHVHIAVEPAAGLLDVQADTWNLSGTYV